MPLDEIASRRLRCRIAAAGEGFLDPDTSESTRLGETQQAPLPAPLKEGGYDRRIAGEARNTALQLEVFSKVKFACGTAQHKVRG